MNTKEAKDLLVKIASNVAIRYNRKITDTVSFDKIEEYTQMVNDLVLDKEQIKLKTVLIDNVITILGYVPILEKWIIIAEEEKFGRIAYTELPDFIINILDEIDMISINYSAGNGMSQSIEQKLNK